MTSLHIAALPGRGVVTVSGGDARKLLQGLITNDMDKLRQPGDALHAALLTPQGKILFAFFVVQTADGFLLETEAHQAAALAKRLTFYKLRAEVKIEEVPGRFEVAAAWPGSQTDSAGVAAPEATIFADPRHPQLGARIIAPAHALPRPTDGVADYHVHRIALGVPDPELDYPLGDTYPHEAGFDVFNGADFDKGCFVGQEVVARMQHKTIVRKRVVRVEGASALPAGNPDVSMGTVVIGRLGSVAGSRGLALIRLDRAIEAVDKSEPIMSGGVALIISAEAVTAYRVAAAARANTP